MPALKPRAQSPQPVSTSASPTQKTRFRMGGAYQVAARAKRLSMADDALVVTEKDGGVRFEVRAKPRAKKSAVMGVKAGALWVSLAAPPVDGAANAELVSLLAAQLGVPRRDVMLVRGEG